MNGRKNPLDEAAVLAALRDGASLYALARKHRVHTRRIAAIRDAAGIPSVQGRRPRAVDPVVRAEALMREGVSTAQAARRSGLGYEAARGLRRRLGIAPGKSGGSEAYRAPAEPPGPVRPCPFAVMPAPRPDRPRWDDGVVS